MAFVANMIITSMEGMGYRSLKYVRINHTYLTFRDRGRNQERARHRLSMERERESMMILFVIKKRDTVTMHNQPFFMRIYSDYMRPFKIPHIRGNSMLNP